MEFKYIWCHKCKRKFTISFGTGDVEIPWKCPKCRNLKTK